ncbi:MAG TPA: magnesium transporter [Bacteroidales bacterium]|nr:magnesium transporter [Bacteroidales bacterium]
MQSFELTRADIDSLKEAIQKEDNSAVISMIGELHAADIAEVTAELETEEAQYIYSILDKETSAEAITEMEEEEREELFKELQPEYIARELINNMDSDDAADVLSELSDELQVEILQKIPDVEQAGDIADLLAYDENTAGGLMATELIRVNINWNIFTCLREMRKQAVNVDEIYYVYAVDDNNIFKGTVTLKNLLLAPGTTKILSLYDPDNLTVNTDTPAAEVASIMEKYNLVALPVIDNIGRLKGRITIDDVVDVIRDEAEKDYQLMSGISEDIDSGDSIWMLTRARIPWLIIALFGGILGSLVISQFTGELSLYPQLVIFIPMITAMGGNVGIQSSAIIVQGLANNSLGLESTSQKLVKELGVAVTNGLLLSSMIFAYNLFFTHSYALTISVSIALFTVIIFASIFGTIVPLFLNRVKIDPALATGPFITTVDDIIGVLIYLLIGKFLFDFMQ